MQSLFDLSSYKFINCESYSFAMGLRGIWCLSPLSIGKERIHLKQFSVHYLKDVGIS